MIARVRDDGKTEFLMDMNELCVFEAMMMHFSLMIPNEVTRCIANKMRMDCNGGVLSLIAVAKNPKAAAKAADEYQALRMQVLKEVEERMKRERDELLERQNRRPDGSPKNDVMAEKMSGVLGKLRLQPDSHPAMTDDEVFDYVIHKKGGTDKDDLVIWPKDVPPEQYDRVCDRVKAHYERTPA